jgi:hypothetical protein
MTLWYLKRTNEERRERYAHLRIFFPHAIAYQVRDWRPSKIIKFIENYALSQNSPLHFQLKGGKE